MLWCRATTESSVGQVFDARRNPARFPTHRSALRRSLLASALLAATHGNVAAATIDTTLGVYNPQVNDNLFGAQIVNAGDVMNLSGPQLFMAGDSGARSTPLSTLASNGRIVAGLQWLGAARLYPGTLNYGVTVPDPITGGTRVTSTYATANLTNLAPVTGATTVPDDVNVNGGMYVNARVATVNAGGTLNVNIGTPGALSTASTNGWTMAAKSTYLFEADGAAGTATSINWASNNRITFTGDVAPTTVQSYSIPYVSSYGGTFTITTADGVTSTHTVNNAADLQAYNNYLIAQLQSGNLDPTQYTTDFNKAYTYATQSVQYTASATPDDEVALPIGPRVVIHANGPGAAGNVAAGATLEVVNSNTGAMRADNGGSIVNNGTLATTHTAGDGTAMAINAASGQNSGVINGNFFLAANGSTTDGAYGSNVVNLTAASTFSNTGIINLATGATNGAGASTGINVTGGSTATSSGIINVGVTGSKANGSMTGVSVDGTSAFTNTADGTIYIGRAPQTNPAVNTADVAVNQGTQTAGISVTSNGTATNAGTLTIGSKTQNAAGIVVNNGMGANVTNSGTININGAAATVPRENDGILVNNSRGVTNTGTINLNGVNGVGIKVLSTNATASSAVSTGTINVAGGADPASGTRNFGVWVEGQASGTATATVGGAINLQGNGAIGIHARGRATVFVAASAVPTFSGGSNQIAFYAYGPNALINVAASALDVTTTGSTLFRVDGGALFDGSGLSLTASGNNSQTVVGTGVGSRVTTQDATIDVSGANATGVMVEGGATGSIDAATRVDLSGMGAVAGIVDGQAHTLAGVASGSPNAGTTLTSAATLTSSQTNLVGYIARNQAKFTNSGDVTFSGANATGIRAESGATATNSGAISVTDGGTGMVVDGSTGTLVTTGNDTGAINVNGGSIGARTRGLVATGAKAVGNLQAGAVVTMNGIGAIGAEAINGGTVNVAASATPRFNNTDQIAFHAQGAGATIKSAATSVDASTSNATIYRIDDGATLSLSGTPTLTASGSGAKAIVGSGASTRVTTNAARINVTGSGATGVQADGGSTVTLSSGTQVTVGSAGIGGTVDGLRTLLDGTQATSPVATTLTNNGVVSGSGANAVGFIARNLGTLNNAGTVNLGGAGDTGVWLQGGGTLTNTGTVHVANGTGIQVEGAQSQIRGLGNVTVDDGLAGTRLLNGAQTTLDGQGGTLTTHGSADGILLDAGAASLMASHTTLITDGSGNGIENAAEISAVALDNLTINVGNGAGIRTATAFDPSSITTINVNGSGTGFAFRRADGSMTDGDLDLGSGYVVNANGAGATGIQALTSGHVTTAANVSVTSAAGGAALVAGTAADTTNTGTLVSASTSAPVVDLSNGGGTSFTNSGSIEASSVTATAIRGSAGNDTVMLTDGAVTGDIATGAGSDRFAWTGGTLAGSLTMGNGAGNTALVQGVDLATTSHLTAGAGGGNTLTLSDIVSRGGSFVADDAGKGVNLGSGWNTISFSDGTAFTLTDNLHLANSDVNIDATSTLYAGDNVHPVISGATATSAQLTNAGLIDLTNGAGSPGNSLTVDGDYVSQGGQVAMVSTLNFGGALANQFTDRLLITGNVTTPGGPTILNVTPSMLSDGELTDANHNSATDANEGISVVQVAGTSTADAFRLAGGSVSAGPWQYGLYAFAPGYSATDQRVVSGSGTQYWDYRLANIYICESDCTPVTQVNPAPNPAPGEPANPTPPPPETPTSVAPADDQAPDDGCVVDGIDNCAPGRREVAAQVPTYIAAPTAIAAYGWQVLDNLHRRLGEIRHDDASDDELGGEAFARLIGGDYTYQTDRSFRQYGYNIDQQIRALQIGANIIDVDGQHSSFRSGIAYTHGTNLVEPDAPDGYSRTKYYSNSVAAYFTWQHDKGFYVDAVVSGDRSQGDVNVSAGTDLGRLRASGWTASLETGYPWRWGDGWELEPQLQLARMHVGLRNFTDNSDALVQFDDYNQNVGRLGVRLDRSWTDSHGGQGTPYVRLNLIQGWGGRPSVNVSDAAAPEISQTFLGGNYGRAVQLGLGGTYTLGKSFSFYGEGDYQKEVGNAGTRGWSATLGVRWRFPS